MTLEALGVGELVEQEYIEREESLTQNPEEAPHDQSKPTWRLGRHYWKREEGAQGSVVLRKRFQNGKSGQ